VDSRASVVHWGDFSSALRSAPSFLDFSNRTYIGVYPKSIIAGEIFLLNAEGETIPGWPVSVSGIGFGSPLLFKGGQTGAQRPLAAFVTQAGELTVYRENAEILPGFPLDLDGVFFIQPVFDGEHLWLIESAGTLFRVGLDGDVASQSIPRLSVKEEGYITMAGAEVFFTGEGNALHGYAKDFAPLAGFPLPVWGRPVIGDIDGDGRTEVAGMGMDNRLYMWQLR
jgi:hypothetical protein